MLQNINIDNKVKEAINNFGTKYYLIQITHRKNLRRFLDMIGFTSTNKKVKLTHYLEHAEKVPYYSDELKKEILRKVKEGTSPYKLSPIFCVPARRIYRWMGI